MLRVGWKLFNPCSTRYYPTLTKNVLLPFGGLDAGSYIFSPNYRVSRHKRCLTWLRELLVFIVHPSLVREPSALSPDNPFASIFQSLIRHIFGQTKHTRYMLLQRFMYTLVVHHHGIKPRWVKNGMLSRWKTRVFHVHVPFCYAASCSLFRAQNPVRYPRSQVCMMHPQ